MKNFDQFKSVFTKQDHLEETPKLNEPRYPKIDNLHISIEGVEKLLHNLDPNKASGPDNIPNKILKLCAKELAPAVTHIFNQSLNTGTRGKSLLKMAYEIINHK